MLEKYPEKRGVRFLAYSNGKSACKVKDAHSGGAHHFVSKGFIYKRGKFKFRIMWKSVFPFFNFFIVKETKLAENIPVILHYPNCGYKLFHNKYKNVHLNFSDKWLGTSEISKGTPFHLEARNIFRTNDESVVLDFYKKRILVEEVIIDELIKEEIVVKITKPSYALRKYSNQEQHIPLPNPQF